MATIITTISVLYIFLLSIWPKAHAIHLERRIRMLVMMAIFEKTFIRSVSPLSKAVRALGLGRH